MSTTTTTDAADIEAGITGDLARFAAGLGMADLPAAVTQRIGLLALDAVGNAVRRGRRRRARGR